MSNIFSLLEDKNFKVYAPEVYLNTWVFAEQYRMHLKNRDATNTSRLISPIDWEVDRKRIFSVLESEKDKPKKGAEKNNFLFFVNSHTIKSIIGNDFTKYVSRKTPSGSEYYFSAIEYCDYYFRYVFLDNNSFNRELSKIERLKQGLTSKEEHPFLTKYASLLISLNYPNVSLETQIRSVAKNLIARLLYEEYDLVFKFKLAAESDKSYSSFKIKLEGGPQTYVELYDVENAKIPFRLPYDKKWTDPSYILMATMNLTPFHSDDELSEWEKGIEDFSKEIFGKSTKEEMSDDLELWKDLQSKFKTEKGSNQPVFDSPEMLKKCLYDFNYFEEDKERRKEDKDEGGKPGGLKFLRDRRKAFYRLLKVLANKEPQLMPLIRLRIQFEFFLESKANNTVESRWSEASEQYNTIKADNRELTEIEIRTLALDLYLFSSNLETIVTEYRLSKELENENKDLLNDIGTYQIQLFNYLWSKESAKAS